MPNKPPPRPPKGGYPGAGRKKGTPNGITVEVRQLVSELVNDLAYQMKLRQDFRRRKVHPTIESLIWAYHLGKPTQPVTVAGSMALDVSGRLEEDRQLFARLEVADLEVLAAESQRLVDRARMLARAASPAIIGPDGGESAEAATEPAETLENQAGSDNTYYVNQTQAEPEDDNP